MLVLQRTTKADRDAILIGPIPPEAVGQTIRVVVCGVLNDGWRVKVGVEADGRIPVVREELAGSHRGSGPSGEAIERRARRRQGQGGGR